MRFEIRKLKIWGLRLDNDKGGYKDNKKNVLSEDYLWGKYRQKGGRVRGKKEWEKIWRERERERDRDR